MSTISAVTPDESYKDNVALSMEVAAALERKKQGQSKTSAWFQARQFYVTAALGKDKAKCTKDFSTFSLASPELPVQG